MCLFHCCVVIMKSNAVATNDCKVNLFVFNSIHSRLQSKIKN